MKKTLILLLAAIPAGIAVGALDALFGRVLLYIGAVRDAHVVWLVPFLGVAGAAMAWAYKHYGAGCEGGLGTNLINAALEGGTVYAWDWALKLVLTALTLSAGYQGGEVTPLFSIGASLGAALAGVLGLPLGFTAALGYAAVFGSATNTLIAPALIAAEVFGWACAPYALAACAIAYAVNGGRSIYAGQRRA